MGRRYFESNYYGRVGFMLFHPLIRKFHISDQERWMLLPGCLIPVCNILVCLKLANALTIGPYLLLQRNSVCCVRIVVSASAM